MSGKHLIYCLSLLSNFILKVTRLAQTLIIAKMIFSAFLLMSPTGKPLMRFADSFDMVPISGVHLTH